MSDRMLFSRRCSGYSSSIQCCLQASLRYIEYFVYKVNNWEHVTSDLKLS